MGQWTPDYRDDVLRSKIKNLVSGSIKRIKLEKQPSSITYEAFVEALDEGDSFTTSIIDILVKELAERQSRQSGADRRLISESTAKGLTSLANTPRLYRDRVVPRPANHRNINLIDYLTSPPDELDLEDDEEEEEDEHDLFRSTSPEIPIMEGARLNTDLYDAYLPYGSANSGAASERRAQLPYTLPDPPQSSNETNSNTNDNDPSATLRRTRPSLNWGLGSLARRQTEARTGAASLSRQPSVHRNDLRSRTVDFSDFTARRRYELRQAARERAEARRDSQTTRRTTEDRAQEAQQEENSASGAEPRRYFSGLGPTRRHEISLPPWPRTRDDEIQPPFNPFPPMETSGRPFRSISPPFDLVDELPILPSHRRSRSGTADSEDRTRSSAYPAPPRLRRGGVRAPESLLSPFDEQQRSRSSSGPAQSGSEDPLGAALREEEEFMRRLQAPIVEHAADTLESLAGPDGELNDPIARRLRARLDQASAAAEEPWPSTVSIPTGDIYASDYNARLRSRSPIQLSFPFSSENSSRP